MQETEAQLRLKENVLLCRACELLLEVGVEEGRIDKLLDDAASWRVNPNSVKMLHYLAFPYPACESHMRLESIQKP